MRSHSYLTTASRCTTASKQRMLSTGRDSYAGMLGRAYSLRTPLLEGYTAASRLGARDAEYSITQP